MKGVVLNICSKNEYDIGVSGLQGARSILKEEDFVVKKINWQNKAENVREILEELYFLEDAVVFVDDSEVECNGVRWMLPQIETIQMSDVNDFLEKMDTLSFFEMVRTTQEDEKRNKYYTDNLARKKERKEYRDYDAYLKALHMVCYVQEVCDNNIDRVVQLMNKTNQFNFVTGRYTLEETTERIKKKEIKTFVLELEDKFGMSYYVPN